MQEKSFGEDLIIALFDYGLSPVGNTRRGDNNLVAQSIRQVESTFVYTLFMQCKMVENE